MNYETIAFDEKSAREIDNNGFLHVSVSNLTKVQVAPYYGHEIPEWEKMQLDPKKTYYGYRSPEELSRPETIKSINGIPIQLKHHLDYPEQPAKDTRVGSTGTDGAWRPPYLTNSLHIIDKTAQDAIRSGAMRELSLAYAYRPDFSPGVTDKGEHYDFVMRDILANHVALVEAGRAGHDVLVNDHSFEEKENMDENEKLDDTEKVAEQPKPEVEQKEIDLAKGIGVKAKELEDLHEEEGGEIKHEGEDAEPDDDSEYDALAASLDEDPEVESEEDSESPEDDEEEVEEEEEDEDEGAFDEDYVCGAMQRCGLDSTDEETKRLFIEGLKDARKKCGSADKPEGEAEDADKEEEVKEEEEKEEVVPEKKDDEPLKTLGMDEAIRATSRLLSEKFDALNEVRSILGEVKFGAFDTAGDVYCAALKQMGVTGVSALNARDCYMAYMKGKKDNTSSVGTAMDEKPHDSAIARLLGKVL